MEADHSRARVLAHRLRALREGHWEGVSLTQSQLGRALGGTKPLSVALISSWENPSNPKIPPENRLSAYATFFATYRSVERRPVRLLRDADLTATERAARDDLLRELRALREAALRGDPAPESSPHRGIWHFPDLRCVTIVCAQLPSYFRDQIPYADPNSPDYIEAYHYADLDALLELYGHIRATNPRNHVNYRLASTLTIDDLTTHLVLLGGVDWNPVTGNCSTGRRCRSGKSRATEKFPTVDLK